VDHDDEHLAGQELTNWTEEQLLTVKTPHNGSWDSVVNIGTWNGLDNLGLNPGRDKTFFFSPKCPE
jgi:hypothetical protein